MQHKEKPTSAIDKRRHDFFIVDNSVFDSGIAAEIGTSAFSVYCFLIRRANENAECWPSRAGIQAATGLGKDTVQTAIALLQARRMITRTDTGERYHFEINDHNEWLVSDHHGIGRKNRPGEKIAQPRRKNRPQVGEKIAPKNTHKTIPTEEDTILTPATAAAGAQEPLLTLVDAPVILPGNLTAETWRAFKSDRKVRKIPIGEYAERLLLKKLERLVKDGESTEAVVQQSIELAYRGVFPVRVDRAVQGNQKPTETTWDEIANKTIWENPERVRRMI